MGSITNFKLSTENVYSNKMENHVIVETTNHIKELSNSIEDVEKTIESVFKSIPDELVLGYNPKTSGWEDTTKESNDESDSNEEWRKQSPVKLNEEMFNKSNTEWEFSYIGGNYLEADLRNNSVETTPETPLKVKFTWPKKNTPILISLSPRVSILEALRKEPSFNFQTSPTKKSETPKFKAYKCSKCNQCYSKREKLLRHVEETHRKVEYNRCSECSFVAYQKMSLIRHLKREHQI